MRWVLLRGLTRESAHWGPFVDQLKAALPEADVLTIDLPGNGELHREPSPVSVEAMAAAARAALRRRGAAPPYHLLAMSLGAMVAVAWARQWPGEIAGCVLINTSLRPFSPFYRRLRPANYAALLRLALAPAESPRAIEQSILELTSSHPEANAGVLDAWVACRQARPVSSRNALRQLAAAARFRAPLAAPTARLLLLASTHDGLVDSSCSRTLALRWQAPIAEHPEAGHDLPLDDGPWVVRRVRAWLNEQIDEEELDP